MVACLLACVFAGCKRSSNDAAKASGTNAPAQAAKATGPSKAPGPQAPAAPTPSMNAARQPGRVDKGRGPMVRTNSVGALRTNPKTNAPVVARTAGKTNTVAGQPAPPAKAGGGLAARFRGFLNSTMFYPVVVSVAIALSFGGLFLYQYLTSKKKPGGKEASAEAPPVSRPLAVKKARKTPVNACNVLHFAPAARHLWQFAAKGRGFVLNREQTALGKEPLPERAITKNWTSLWQRKLNIAWLPPEQVFLRVAQLPESNFEETLSMVELQLEKLSPMPVTQIVWSIQVLPHTLGNLQTVIVMVVARNIVEEFLGQLEGQGYLADRLELPRLDQLLATAATGDGAWIYPETTGARNTALVAWWYGGVLQNLGLIHLSLNKKTESLKEQLVQLAWAGELEGWLTAPPSWHLVADTVTAGEWEPPLRGALEQAIEVVPALPLPELAAKTATRAVRTEAQANLLPGEFSTRYHQQFVDRLWMRGVGAVIGLYLIGVVIYWGRVKWEDYGNGKVDDEVAQVGPVYTNSVQLKTKYQILKDRQDLQMAALDTWKLVAELLPEGMTLEGYNLTDGKRLVINGTAPVGQEKSLLDFDKDLRNAPINGQPLFDANEGEHITWRQGAAGVVNWNCVLMLKRSEEL